MNRQRLLIPLRQRILEHGVAHHVMISLCANDNCKDIEFAAQADTYIPDSGICIMNGYKFIYSGTNSRAAHDITLCLIPKTTRA